MKIVRVGRHGDLTNHRDLTGTRLPTSSFVYPPLPHHFHNSTEPLAALPLLSNVLVHAVCSLSSSARPQSSAVRIVFKRFHVLLTNVAFAFVF